eukprot:5658936-Alexandrium_andersonii.AAC.1
MPTSVNSAGAHAASANANRSATSWPYECPQRTIAPSGVLRAKPPMTCIKLDSSCNAARCFETLKDRYCGTGPTTMPSNGETRLAS